ncbi:MAG: ABC transporter ATP-binding protein/permease [Acidobacteriia bacterium]|nr:ABC transporter ATP-binding protein/permease [Terriglobia bacterium]
MSRSMTPNAAPATTKYTLETGRGPVQKPSLRAGLQRLLPLMAGERVHVIAAFTALAISTAASLTGPVIVGRTVDHYIGAKDYPGLVSSSLLLLGVYLAGVFASYMQVRTMGSVGRRGLFRLRNSIFTKLQELPVAFFNQNKAGDLISRINNDTDKLNVFISQVLMQFVGSMVMITGAGVFLLALNLRLGIAALLPAAGAMLVTRATSTWVKQRNLRSLQTLGGMSSEIQETLSNFKVIVAFNRTDYFREKLNTANQKNFLASIGAGMANGVFMPLYGWSANLAQLVVIAYGIYLIGAGHLTVGLLIGFLLYVNSFYMPMRQLATVWSSFQLAVAALDRVHEVLVLESNLPVIAAAQAESDAVLTFRQVHFHYPGGKEVLREANFELEKGKAYALVGPTGGGKTTTASIMARLYDPSQGSVLLNGRDIRSYQPEERARRIGFIPQEPFLFSGTVRDNLLYGNPDYQHYSNEQFAEALERANLSALLARFPQGLDTAIAASGNSVSLGQKQLIAFMRATLRKPDLLILDEATASNLRSGPDLLTASKICARFFLPRGGRADAASA